MTVRGVPGKDDLICELIELHDLGVSVGTEEFDAAERILRAMPPSHKRDQALDRLDVLRQWAVPWQQQARAKGEADP